jgi:flagellar motor switch protein FliN
MADGDNIQQDEIDKLVQQAGGAPEPPGTPDAPASDSDGTSQPQTLDFSDLQPVSFASEPTAPTTIDDVQLLLTLAEGALASVAHPAPAGPHAQPFELSELQGAPASSEQATIDLLRDVELDLRIELGRTNLPLEDVLKLKRGAVVPLDKLAGDPVDIYVNRRLVARGEVLVLNDNFCVRVAELLSGDDLN